MYVIRTDIRKMNGINTLFIKPKVNKNRERLLRSQKKIIIFSVTFYCQHWVKISAMFATLTILQQH